MTDTQQKPRFRRLRIIAKVTHWLLLIVPLVNAGVCLVNLPGVERAVLIYFAPPVIACLFLLADTGKFEPIVVRGCWVFLNVVAVGVILGQQNLFFPGVMPAVVRAFPGMPFPANRFLMFYFIAYFSFLLVVCPAWCLVSKWNKSRQTAALSDAPRLSVRMPNGG